MGSVRYGTRLGHGDLENKQQHTLALSNGARTRYPYESRIIDSRTLRCETGAAHPSGEDQKGEKQRKPTRAHCR